MTAKEKKIILTGLVKNGLRHLDRGLKGFESGELDFAATDAFFGIEILLKALVFETQWELIFDEPGDANLEKLKAGNCRTIGWEKAAKRLRNLIKKPLPKSCSQFEALQTHRNKLVHFFHPGLVNATEKVAVARDLSNAWAALLEVCALPQFELIFRDHHSDFRALNGRLLVINDYLDQQTANIRSLHAHPESLQECPACKRATFNGDCALCGYNEPTHRELTQGAEFIPHADCPKCGAIKTVMPSGDAGRCTSCGDVFECIGTCAYCGSSFASDPNSDPEAAVGSYYFGCDNCSGRIANS